MSKKCDRQFLVLNTFLCCNICFICFKYIQGLDPARPLYENSDPQDRLDKDDANYVDVIHTNGDQNGILRSLGNIDFFPNGGKSQPNCPKVQDKGKPLNAIIVLIALKWY